MIEKKQQTIIGTPFRRLDWESKACGQTVYGTDISLPGMLIAKMVRSPYAHARIKKIDVSKAQALPGVVAVMEGKEHPFRVGRSIGDQPPLALDKVIYIGEPVVAVAAETEEIADAAVALVEVEYEPLEPALDVEAGCRDGIPLVHPGMAEYPLVPPAAYVPGTNICGHRVVRHGDIEAGFAAADIIVEGRYETPMEQHCCLEPQCCIARWEADGALTLWDSTQSIYRVRKALAAGLKMKESQIRIIVPYLGGGFGEKNSVNQELVAAALAMHTNGRPVKVELNRDEEFTAGMAKHSTIIYIKSGVKKDGTITARQVTAYYDTGAYAHTGPTVAGQAGLVSAGPYRIENALIEVFSVYTNRIPAGSFRGYGVPQVCWAHEQHTEEIAARLGMDIVTFRRKTVLRNGDVNIFGERMKESAIYECYERAAAAIGALDTAERIGPHLIRARGIGGAWKLTGSPSTHLATIRLEPDGSAVVGNSTVEMGQGCLSLWQGIVCEELALDFRDVKVLLPDSATTPYTEGTTSSRAGPLDGRAVYEAAQIIKEQLFALAAPVLKTSPEHLDVKDGCVIVPRTGKSISYRDLMTKAGLGTVGGLFAQGECRTNDVVRPDAEASQSPHPTSMWLQQVQAVELVINTMTGEITIERCVSAHDVGKVLSLTNCEQQSQGGVIMGLGTALYEALRFNDKGRVLNASFLDYKIPTIRQVPKIESIFVEDAPSTYGAYGAKGIGEGADICVPSAVGSAVFHATGIQMHEIPITAEKMYLALKERGLNTRGNERRQ